MAESTTKTTLPKDVFSLKVENHELVKLAYDAYLANARLASATTKTRGEVRGGGKKPWKQKGTGRARFGSTRNPIWRTGGIVFGPLGNENYTKKLSKVSKRVAIKQALSLAHAAKKIMTLDVKATGKTADFVAFLQKNNCARKTLIVVDEKTPELLRATSNLQNVIVSKSTYLNVYNIMNADHIVISPASLATIDAWLNPKEEK